MLLKADYIFLLLNIDWNLNGRWRLDAFANLVNAEYPLLKWNIVALLMHRKVWAVSSLINWSETKKNCNFRTENGCAARSSWQAEAKICSWSVNCQLVTPLSIYATTDDAFMHILWIVWCKCAKIIILFIILICSRSFGWRTTSRKWVIKQWLFQLKIIIIAAAHLF